MDINKLTEEESSKKETSKLKGKYVIALKKDYKLKLKEKYKDVYPELDLNNNYSIDRVYDVVFSSLPATIVHIKGEKVQNPYLARHFEIVTK